MKDQRHAVKRRIAKTSFAAILLTLAALLCLIAFGGENVARNLNASSGSLAAILGFLTSIVIGYMGIVHHDDVVNRG
jgi:uncharacterized integral membrane protein